MAEISKSKLFAQSNINRLLDCYEMIIGETKDGRIIGHYAGNQFFFYCNGKQLFRNSDKSKAIIFIGNLYSTIIAQ
jgi:hypothetical protein